jgi:hypothetical protein
MHATRQPGGRCPGMPKLKPIAQETSQPGRPRCTTYISGPCSPRLCWHRAYAPSHQHPPEVPRRICACCQPPKSPTVTTVTHATKTRGRQAPPPPPWETTLASARRPTAWGVVGPSPKLTTAEWGSGAED